MTNKELLLQKIRPVTEEDRGKLPKFSYSKMDTLKTCPYQYNLKYNEGLYTSESSLALELGSLLHKVLEEKGKMLLTDDKTVCYNKLNEIKHNGCEETDAKTISRLAGIEELKDKYIEWDEPDNASGMNYDEKMEIFDQVLKTEMEDDDWKPILFEHNFEFVWDDRAIIHGFIDRIDFKNGKYRTCDYKTSKKIYDKSKLSTSLQFGVYALAILNEFGSLPIESIYRFILLDETQYALTNGWEKRLIKALDKIFDAVDENELFEMWQPKPCPLCYWCSYCNNNPDAFQYADRCEYYSLWTPFEKSFKVNKAWEG